MSRPLESSIFPSSYEALWWWRQPANSCSPCSGPRVLGNGGNPFRPSRGRSRLSRGASCVRACIPHFHLAVAEQLSWSYPLNLDCGPVEHTGFPSQSPPLQSTQASSTSSLGASWADGCPRRHAPIWLSMCADRCSTIAARPRRR